MTRSTLRRLTAGAALPLVLATAGCGGDSGEETSAAENPNADLDRYCRLSEQLARAGDRQLEKLERPNATDAEVEDAQREFVEQNADRIDEVIEVAPAEVQGDARTFLEGLRSNLGLSGADVNPRDVGAADERLREFAQENCPS